MIHKNTNKENPNSSFQSKKEWIIEEWNSLPKHLCLTKSLKRIKNKNIRNTHSFIGGGFSNKIILFGGQEKLQVFQTGQNHKTLIRDAISLLAKIETLKVKYKLPLSILISYDFGAHLMGETPQKGHMKSRSNSGMPYIEVATHDAALTFIDNKGYYYGSSKDLETFLEEDTSHQYTCSYSPQTALKKQFSNKEQHARSLRNLKKDIFNGVVYQANICHSLSIKPASFEEGLSFLIAKNSEAEIKQMLLPKYTSFYDDSKSGSIISLSPECFIKVNGFNISTYPIKGTIKKNDIVKTNHQQREELLSSSKENAEHLMIVDLLRNDLSQICEKKSVHVESLMKIVELEHIYHLQSTVKGYLKNNLTFSDYICPLLPCGSISGAPKKTAVEAINQYEMSERGLYTGHFGYIWSDIVELSVLIRSWIRPDNNEGSISVGGGIVWDSNTENEWSETIEKSHIFFN